MRLEHRDDGRRFDPMKRFAVPLLLSLALRACASMDTAYGPAYGPRGAGYSEFRIEPDRFRVNYQGGPGAPAEEVANYALLRAAELTLSQGRDWFQVTDRASSGRLGGCGPRFSVGAGSGSYGRTSVGVGLGTSFSLGGGPAVAHSIEIVMGQGAKPADPNAYDARAVRAALSPRA